MYGFFEKVSNIKPTVEKAEMQFNSALADRIQMTIFANSGLNAKNSLKAIHNPQHRWILHTKHSKVVVAQR